MWTTLCCLRWETQRWVYVDFVYGCSPSSRNYKAVSDFIKLCYLCQQKDIDKMWELRWGRDYVHLEWIYEGFLEEMVIELGSSIRTKAIWCKIKCKIKGKKAVRVAPCRWHENGWREGWGKPIWNMDWSLIGDKYYR